jgi:hypothetical protein
MIKCNLCFKTPCYLLLIQSSVTVMIVMHSPPKVNSGYGTADGNETVEEEALTLLSFHLSLYAVTGFKSFKT